MKPETTVVCILVTKVPVTEGEGEKVGERGAESSSGRQILKRWFLHDAAGVEFDIYGRQKSEERTIVCVRRIIRRLYFRNNRSKFSVNRFAADTFYYTSIYMVYGKFLALAQFCIESSRAPIAVR